MQETLPPKFFSVTLLCFQEFNLVIQQKEQLQSDMQKLQVEYDHLRLESEKRHDIEMEKEQVMLVKMSLNN